MWYIANSPSDTQSLKYTHELENIHNELNYLNLRGKYLNADMVKRYLAFVFAFYTFYAFYEIPSYDW